MELKSKSVKPKAKTPFDKRLLQLKNNGCTYREMAEILSNERFKSPSGKPITRTLVQSRFNYIIGRRDGPVQVLRGAIRKFELPQMITLESELPNEEKQSIHEKLDEILDLLRRKQNE